MPITHKYTITCDQVRKEDNGKYMLLGVYTPDILVPQLPFSLPLLTFFMCLEADGPGKHDIKFQLSHLETGKSIASGGGEINFAEPGLAYFPIAFGTIHLEAVGVYTFSMKSSDQENPLITEFSVTLRLPRQG